MIQTESGNAIRRIRVLATAVIVLWHCLCLFVPTAWAIYYAPEIGTAASNIFKLALGDIMLPIFFMLSVFFIWIFIWIYILF